MVINLPEKLKFLFPDELLIKNQPRIFLLPGKKRVRWPHDKKKPWLDKTIDELGTPLQRVRRDNDTELLNYNYRILTDGELLSLDIFLIFSDGLPVYVTLAWEKNSFELEYLWS